MLENKKNQQNFLEFKKPYLPQNKFLEQKKCTFVHFNSFNLFLNFFVQHSNNIINCF